MPTSWLWLWTTIIVLSHAWLGGSSNASSSGSGIAPPRPEVYYINMATSLGRRRNMEHKLRAQKLKYFRVDGNLWSTIYVPPDVSMFWSLPWCIYETEEIFPPYDAVQRNISSHLHNYSSIMSGLCGRGTDKNGKTKNTLKELGCVTSHIVAIHQAVHSKTSSSKYALILEDDVKFVFDDVDFERMAESAPADFGILQLFNSNLPSMVHTMTRYSKDPTGQLWFRNPNNLMYWSTCAYLINRKVMEPIIDKLMYQRDGWTHFKVLAGKTEPCTPQACCAEGGKHTRWGLYNTSFLHTAPCTYAPFGFQADSYLYSLVPTYVLAVPVFTNGKGGNSSTFHQDHVELLHRDAFRRQRQIVNEMYAGKLPLPPFVSQGGLMPPLLNESLI